MESKTAMGDWTGLLAQIAQTGLLGALLVLALLSIWWQRREITALWERLVTGGKTSAELASSTNTTLQSLITSNDQRGQAANEVAKTTLAAAEAVRAVGDKVHITQRMVEEQGREVTEIMREAKAAREILEEIRVLAKESIVRLDARRAQR